MHLEKRIGKRGTLQPPETLMQRARRPKADKKKGESSMEADCSSFDGIPDDEWTLNRMIAEAYDFGDYELAHVFERRLGAAAEEGAFAPPEPAK